MITDTKITRFVEIDGHAVPVWIYGDLKNPAIIFIHGYYRGFSEYTGDLPMRYLKDDFCIIAFDLPGFATSKDISMEKILFIHTVVEEILGKQSYTVFGTSYGGVIALQYAHTYPRKVRNLIISATPYGAFYTLLSVVRLIPLKRTHNLRSLVKDFRFLKKSNLQHITKPVLLHYSTHDKRATVAMGKKLQHLLPQAIMVTITDKTHGWMLHRIDQTSLLEAIRKFVRS